MFIDPKMKNQFQIPKIKKLLHKSIVFSIGTTITFKPTLDLRSPVGVLRNEYLALVI